MSAADNVTVTTPEVSCADQPADHDTERHVPGLHAGQSAGTGSEIVTANVFTIIQGPAIITGVAPNTGNEGQEVVFNITGSATHWQQNFTQFYIAGGGSDHHGQLRGHQQPHQRDRRYDHLADRQRRSALHLHGHRRRIADGQRCVRGDRRSSGHHLSQSEQSALPGTTELQVTINGNAYTQWAQGSHNGQLWPWCHGRQSYQVDDCHSHHRRHQH